MFSRSIRRPGRFAALALLVAGIAAVAPDRPVLGADPLPDVPVVTSPAAPPEGLQVVRLQEMWRAGGPDSDEIFGHIFRAKADAEGNVYLVDSQLSEVPVFSPGGQRLRTLSREGEGPGETREPVDMELLPDGTLGILQRFPAKIVKLTREGAPVRDLTLGEATDGGFTSLFTARCRGDQLMLVIQHAVRDGTSQTRTTYVARCDAEGRELARCFARDAHIDFSNPVIREATVKDPVIFGSTIAPDGRIYVAPDHDRYAIRVYAPDGALHQIVQREFVKRPRSSIEKERVQNVFDLWSQRGGRNLPTEIFDCAPTITDLYVDDANNLWVNHSRSAETGPAEAMLTYDVFDGEGRFRRQVAMVCEGDPVNDELFRLNDDMVLLIKGSIPALYAEMAGGQSELDEAAEQADMEVVCYRIPD